MQSRSQNNLKKKSTGYQQNIEKIHMKEEAYRAKKKKIKN